MSDWDGRKALRVLKQQGCLQAVIELALEEDLSGFDDEQLKALLGHIQFLHVRRHRIWATLRGNKFKVRAMADSHILNCIKAGKRGRIQSGAVFNLTPFWKELFLREAKFRKLTVPK